MKKYFLVGLMAALLSLPLVAKADPITDWTLSYAGYTYSPVDAFTVKGFYNAYLDFGSDYTPNTGDIITLSESVAGRGIYFNLLAYDPSGDSTGLPAGSNKGFYIQSSDLSGQVTELTPTMFSYNLYSGGSATLFYNNTALASFSVTTAYGQNSDVFSTLTTALGTYWIQGSFTPLLAGVFTDKSGNDLYGQTLGALLKGDIQYVPKFVMSDYGPIAEDVDIAAPGQLSIATPEPASMLLLGTGLLGLYGWRRRKGNAA